MARPIHTSILHGTNPSHYGANSVINYLEPRTIFDGDEIFNILKKYFKKKKNTYMDKIIEEKIRNDVEILGHG